MATRKQARPAKGSQSTGRRILKIKRVASEKVQRARGVKLTDAALMTGLSQEAYNVVTDAILALGIRVADQRRGLTRAGGKGKQRRRPSQEVLKNQNAVALLLNTWRSDPRYIQRDGTPKTLPILGSGATLESLVKFYVPDLSVTQVVDILCTHTDVMRLKGERVALLSHPVKITEKTSATTLAWLITQIRHISETVVFNASIPAKAKNVGRFERQVYGSLPKKQFDVWAQTVRKRLQETAERVEADLGSEEQALRTGKEKVCGIGLYVFREDGSLG
jgi:Family of unknown function (DUF6502)